MPKVSVIIPAYNSERFLDRTIRSVINQTYKNWELLVVDDGSTDNTKEIIKSWGQKDERIRGIFLEQNSGAPAHPKNVGIQNSKGKYIAFLDHDDEWLPTKLEKQIELFEESDNPKLGFVSCNAIYVYTKQSITKEYKIPQHKNSFLALLESNFIPGCSSIVIKKLAIKNVGFFDENFEMIDDWDMWIRIAQKYDFDFVPESLFKYYIHGGNITKILSAGKKIEDLQYLLKKHMGYYKMFPKAYSIRMRKLGTRYILDGQILKGKRYFLESIKINPLNIKSYVYFLIYGSKFYKMLSYVKRKIKDKFQL